MAVKKTPYSASIRVRARRDGSTAFDVRYRINGSSKTLSFTRQSGAEKWANLVRAVGPEEALRILNLDVESSPTVAEYAERYIASKSGIEGKTADHYRLYMRVSIGPAMGMLPLEAVSTELVAKWINDQTEEGRAAKTIKNRHGFLSAMFQNAVDDGLIVKNPCRRSRLPASEQLEMVFLTANEFTTLLSFIPPRSQPLVLFLASTGLRWGEASALRPGDFDLDGCTVRVSRAWKSSTEKGYYVGAPKTRRSRRTVSFPRSLAEILRPLIDETGPEDWVFRNARGGPIRQQKFWEFVWAPARNLANGRPAFEERSGKPWSPRPNGVWDRRPAEHPIKKEPRVHDLRHSHVSWLLAEGVPLHIIQRRLGHESITTTVDRYGHIAPDMLHQASAAIGNALVGAMPELER